jgi:phosphoribosyl-ATP pyrophosphohydrolase
LRRRASRTFLLPRWTCPTEVIIAALSEPRDRVVSEVADLIFHVSVLLTDIDIDWNEIGQELGRRAK